LGFKNALAELVEIVGGFDYSWVFIVPPEAPCGTGKVIISFFVTFADRTSDLIINQAATIEVCVTFRRERRKILPFAGGQC
jgi:hypothetical protein